MPKIPALTPRAIIKLLEEHGFILDRVRGSHHIYYQPESGRRAVVPMHRQDLPRGTMLSILKQAGIDRDELTGD
ncbi:MAG: type II toxin-antitoxin system HicA family toxin [Caldilineaceae bacterium]